MEKAADSLFMEESYKNKRNVREKVVRFWSGGLLLFSWKKFMDE